MRRGTGIALALSVALAAVSPVAAQSLTDRFKSLFGGKSDEPAQPDAGAGTRPAGGRRRRLSAGHGARRGLDLRGRRRRRAGRRQ